MHTDDRSEEHARVGLCFTCRCSRVIVSDRGSRFYFCERSKTDPRYPKYPRLPVVTCAGYERAVDPGSL